MECLFIRIPRSKSYSYHPPFSSTESDPAKVQIQTPGWSQHLLLCSEFCAACKTPDIAFAGCIQNSAWAPRFPSAVRRTWHQGFSCGAWRFPTRKRDADFAMMALRGRPEQDSCPRAVGLDAPARKRLAPAFAPPIPARKALPTHPPPPAPPHHPPSPPPAKPTHPTTPPRKNK